MVLIPSAPRFTVYVSHVESNSAINTIVEMKKRVVMVVAEGVHEGIHQLAKIGSLFGPSEPGVEEDWEYLIVHAEHRFQYGCYAER
jgi:hypothetical protein